MTPVDAVQKLHGDEGVLIPLADIVARADVRMIQRRLRFSLKVGRTVDPLLSRGGAGSRLLTNSEQLGRDSHDHKEKRLAL